MLRVKIYKLQYNSSRYDSYPVAGRFLVFFKHVGLDRILEILTRIVDLAKNVRIANGLWIELKLLFQYPFRINWR